MFTIKSMLNWNRLTTVRLSDCVFIHDHYSNGPLNFKLKSLRGEEEEEEEEMSVPGDAVKWTVTSSPVVLPSGAPCNLQPFLHSDNEKEGL